MSHTTTAQTLEDTRQAIHEAVAASEDYERQRSAAHHAQSLANAILLDPDANPQQLERANYYLEEALGLQTRPTD